MYHIRLYSPQEAIHIAQEADGGLGSGGCAGVALLGKDRESVRAKSSIKQGTFRWERLMEMSLETQAAPR